MNIESVVMSNRAVLYGTDLLATVRHRVIRELVIADAGIDDADVLFGQLQSGTDLWCVDAETDFSGMLHSAISYGYERLHFLAHGQPGGITFAGKVCDVEDFTALSGAQVGQPSIHFWSCMTGAGSKGRAFVHRIAEAFGTVVTAFTGLVGAGNKGGSWLPDVFSGDAGLVAPPFVNALAYAHTLPASALKLISVVTDRGVDVQVRLTAGTVIDNADLVLSYDPAKATYMGAIGNPALTGWTWLSNTDPASPGHLLIDGYSLTSINSTSDIVLARISFTLQQGSTEFGASLASETGLGLGNSSVGLGTLPTLDTIIFSSVPVWQPFTLTGELSYAPGATIALDFPVHATDPNGGTITYKASVGQMVGTTFFGVAGVPQIPLTLSNGHLTGSTTVPLQAVAGSYVLRLLADDNTTDTNNGAALDVPFSVTSPDIKIDVNGLPASTPVRASYEMFMDFVLDPSQQSVSGYLASFKVDEDSNGNPVYAYLTDTNNDGMPDHVTDGSRTGTITWNADGIWYTHPTSVTGIEDHYGRFAYDATGDGDVVGLFGFDLTPYTLVPDTNSSDKLVSTFKISSTETGKLYDDDGNGVIDRMKDVETWTDQSGQSHTNTNNYQLTWTDQTHWTAHYTETWTFGSTYDDNGRPATLWFDGREHTIAWQTKGNDNIVATFNFNTQQNGVTVPAVLSLIDSNADNKPDQVMYTDGTVTEYANLVGWTFDANNRPIAVTIVITSDTSSKDLFSGVAFGSSSNLTTILLPSSNDVSNITLNTTGLVGGTPLPNESYNKFHSGTGVLATAGDNGFSLNLTNDNDNNPLTFNASWSWLNSSGQITQTSTGVLTFQDTDTTKAGPEQWSGTFNRVDTGVLVADGADADTLPDGFVVGDDMGNDVTVPLVWQTKDTNNVVATFTATVKNSNNSDITFSGVLKDTNSDTKPDTIAGTWGSETFNLPFSFTDTNSDGTPDHWRMIESQTQSGRVQVDASGNPAGLYLANSNNSGIIIDFNGSPTGTPASYEVFQDFYQSTPTPSLTGYQASFQSIWKDALGVNVTSTWGVFDTNGDGIGDSYTETYTHAGTQTNNSGTIIWNANGIVYSHQTAGDMATAQDIYGRLAYDAQGDVVGLYAFHLTPYTLVPDTNSGDKLVSTFTISSTDKGYLYDDDSNGVIDRMKDVETWTDQSGQSHTNTNNYQLTWTDAVHWTAHYTEAWTFGSTYDDNGRPATLWFDGSEHTIAWQTKGNDNIVATVNFNTQQNGVTVPAVLSLIDSNADNKPDQVMYTDGTVTEYANLVGWTFDANNHPTGVNIVVTSDTSSEDLFSGMVIGTNSNPTTILVPSSDYNNNITINTSGSVDGTPHTGEGYYKFDSSTGAVARINDEYFYLDLYSDGDNNPLTFEANWSRRFNSGDVCDTSTGGLTFFDTDTSRPGPERWSATFTVDNGLLLADGADTDTLPDGFVVNDYMDNRVNVPLVWQPKDANNVIATFSVLAKDENNNDLTYSGVLKDSNGDNQPDNLTATFGTRTINVPFSFADTNSDGQPDHWIIQRSETVSGRVQVDASGNPAGLYVTWYVPDKDTLINNELTFNLGITAPQLAASGYVVVKSANSYMGMSGANVPVSALSVNGSWLIVPLSGTDAVTGNPYYLYSSTDADLFVEVPAGTVAGQTENLFKAWEVGSMSSNSGYALSPMNVVHTNSPGTEGADWVTGTSGNDSIAAGAGDDILQWSDGNDTIDAGPGYDRQYLPVTTMMYTMNQLDANGVLHITAGGESVTGGMGTDLYRVSKFSDTSYQIQKVDSAGTAVTQTMQLSNAEVLSAGHNPVYLEVQYNTEYGYVNGTPWDDTIVLDTVSAVTQGYVWGNTGNDVLAMKLAPVYSTLEIVNNGAAYVLKGTLAGQSGTVVELGQLTMSEYGGTIYGGTMTLGTGENARSFSFSAIEAFRFVSGSVVYDFALPVNHPPVGYVGIDGNPLQGETLVVSVDLRDGDFENSIIPSDAIHYQWQADGTNIEDETGTKLVLGEALVDKTITVNVSYTDPHGTQESVSSYESLTIVNVNDPPTGAVTIQGTAAKGQTLAANISTLADADGLGYISYQWYADTQELLNATHNTYTPGVSEVGKKISVTASYWDGHNTWESVTSAATSPVIDNTNNPASGTVTISGTATQNKTLIANFNIVDLDGVSGSVYAYQWQADGVAITGATNRNYQLKEAEVGKKLTVTVSFNDDAGYHESLTSSATRAVVNVNDRPAGTVTIHGTAAAEDQILTADISALTDADGLGAISYQWQADGGNIAGASESSYTLTQAEVGAKITVVASYTDGHGTFESKSSAATAAVANVNDAPTLLAGETLIIGSAVVGEELFVNSGVLSDEDGPDVLRITSYQWQADGTNINGANESSYVLTSADAGKAITVTVTYTDAFNNLEHFTSAATAAVVTNANLQNGSVAISGNLTQGETLTAIVTDGDGFGTITYQWRVNTGSAAAPEWTNIAGATGATLLLKEAQVGKQLQVSASYTDNNGTIESPDSSTTTAVANVNDTPTGSVTISGTAKQGETLIAGNTLADLDGIPAGAITYKWQANGSDIAGAAGDHYTLKQAEVGKTITVIAHYTDGHGYGENVPSVSTVAVTNLNDAPTGIVKITGGGQQGEMLTASNTLADADGMGTVSYQWQANGVNISGAENDSYQLTQAEVGKAITVTASYTDGGGTLESVRSAATSAILNVNDRPTGGVTIDGTAKQGQRLTVNTSALYDADGIPDQALLNYQWQAGGLNIDGANSGSFLLTQTEVGKAITVKVFYIDLQGTSESVRSSATGNVANVNDLPTGTVTITGTPTQGETLSATNNLVDRDGPPTLAISYQWQADGVDIAGAVDSYYELTQSDVGKRMAVVASYTDAFTKAEHVSSIATAAIANINDAPTGTVTISGNAAQGGMLTANTTTLVDVDGLGSFSYQWQAGGVNITGATNSSYTLTNSEVDKPIKVIVSYTDGFGKAESVMSSQTRLVRNTNDAPTGSVTITGTPTQGETLTASNTLADVDGLGTITYQWQADGETIDGATEATCQLTQDEVGKRITVVASYTDGQGTLESILSAVTALVANVNDPPTGSVTVSGTATQGQTLMVMNTLADADGLGTISYQWTVAGSNISGAYGSSLTLTESHVGKKIAVVASYTDGQGHAESVTSNNTAKVKNLNDAPQGEVTISGVFKVGKTLSADNTLTDADGLGAISYQWKANGQDIDGATDREYTLTTAEKGQTMSVVASYTDGHGTIENVTGSATTPVKAVIRGSAHDGYLVNALVWIDDNNNAVRDWTDLNHNGIWDEGEGESWTLTDSTGQYTGLEGTGAIRIMANLNGGTIDISTGNDFTGSFAAPSDATVISALTTLVVAAIDGTTNAAAAAAKVKTALALDASVTITSYDPIAEASKTTTNDAARLVAIKAQSATIQVNNIMDVAVSVAQAASATANTAQVVEHVAESLLAQAGAGTVNLASSAVIATAITAGIPSGATHAPSADVVNAIATALALANSDIAHTADTATGTTASAVADITAIVEAQIVAQNTIVPDAYAAVAANDAGVVTTNTANFDALLTEASGQVETIFVNHQPTGNVTISGVVMPGETLTAANSLVDVEGVGAISYQWLSNGAPITAAIHETYALTAADIGHAITVKASYTDGAGHQEIVNSDPTALLPDAPTSLSDVVVGADHLTNNTKPTVTVDLTHKALEVGEIIQIIDSNHNNAVVSSHTITTQDLTILTAQDIDLLVSLVGLIDDTHALKVQLVDSAGHAGLGSNSITAITVDTTLPTITHPAYASGVVTATLDAALETGDKLYGSVDNGSHWSDIAVTGTAINWSGLTIANDSVVKLKVTDTAGNESITTVPIPVPDHYTLTVDTNYWNNDKVMSGVTVETGSLTDNLGAAIFNNVPDGTKTINPELAFASTDKTAIGLLDAVGILKSLVGLITLNSYQQIAADYDGSGSIGLLDAVGVLKYLVGLPGSTPAWVFVDQNDTSHTPISSLPVEVTHDTTVELIGVLRGDVDGSWASLH